MNQARDKKTGEIIDAESLKHIYEDGLSEYECIDEKCKTKLLPCSFKPINKNRPYFKTLNGENHKKSCQFSKYLKILEKAKNRALTEYELEDMPFPTKYQKIKQKSTDNITVKSNDLEQEQNRQAGIRKKASGDFADIVNKSKVVASISPIVDFYIKCPFNRNIELEIENVRKLYMYWFKRIEKPLSTGKYKGKCIFFGRLHTGKNKTSETNDRLKITLYESEGWESNRDNKPAKQINPFIININKSIISKNKITRIKNEINYAIEDKINAFKNGESNRKKHAFVFFWGEAPKEEEPYVFNVLDGSLVARYTQILPTNKN